MIRPGKHVVMLFGKIVTLEVDFIAADETGKDTFTWEIGGIVDPDTDQYYYDGPLMDKIEGYIYDHGLSQILG